MNNNIKQILLPFLSLFSSVSTLLCCALPALLVTMGMGAALAGLISAAPWLAVISDYKLLIFSVAGLMLCASGLVQWQGRNAPCPTDPLKAKACARLRKTSALILGISSLIYGAGFFFAFIAAKLL